MGLCTKLDVEGRMNLTFSASSFPTETFVSSVIDICSAIINKHCRRSSWPDPVPDDVKGVCMEMVVHFIDRTLVDERYRGLTDADRGEVETAVSTREVFTDELKTLLNPWIKRGRDTPFIARQEPSGL